jgi:putative acetyltransferase
MWAARGISHTSFRMEKAMASSASFSYLAYLTMITLPAGYLLRAATNADGTIIRDLIARVLEDYDLAFDAGKTDAGLFDIEGVYQAHGGCFDILLDAGGQIVGTVGLHRISRSDCEWVRMFLASPSRGQGLGAAPMDHAMAEARRLGFKNILLTTATVLKEAVGLYESRGFSRFHWSDMPSRCDAAYRLDL